MAVSKEEWKRRQEAADAEPAYFGLTWGEFNRLPLRQQQEIRQRVSQFGASHIGLWKTCNLAKCRRARACRGFLTEAQYAAGYLEAFPPCVGLDGERKAQVLAALDILFPPRDPSPKYDGRQRVGEDNEG